MSVSLAYLVKVIVAPVWKTVPLLKLKLQITWPIWKGDQPFIIEKTTYSIIRLLECVRDKLKYEKSIRNGASQKEILIKQVWFWYKRLEKSTAKAWRILCNAKIISWFFIQFSVFKRLLQTFYTICNSEIHCKPGPCNENR